MDLTPDQIAILEQEIRPDVDEYLRQSGRQGHSATVGLSADLVPKLIANGKMPQGYTIRPDGTIVKVPGMLKSMTPLLMAGGAMFGAPLLAGAMGGGGGAAAGAASGGVGIGETGATTGLAGSGFGAAATAAAPSLTQRILGAAKNAAPILTNMAGGKNAADATANNQELANKKFELEAPGTRLRTAIRANLAANAKPVTADWGGPGSGLRGQTVKFNMPSLDFNDDTRQLAQKTIHDQLMSSLNGDDELPDPRKSSKTDKLLGGAGIATSLLGGLR